jgi:hypothetical protein
MSWRRIYLLRQINELKPQKPLGEAVVGDHYPQNEFAVPGLRDSPHSGRTQYRNVRHQQKPLQVMQVTLLVTL